MQKSRRRMNLLHQKQADQSQYTDNKSVSASKSRRPSSPYSIGISSNKESNINIKDLKDLQSHLKNTKMFLNMVIHDLRNPTVSLKMGSMQARSMLDLIAGITDR